MRKLLETYLRRVEWEDSFPIRLYPFVSGEAAAARPIAIDPDVAFGRPIVARNSVSTATIAERIDAGENVTQVADDYELTTEEVEEAVVYERAA